MTRTNQPYCSNCGYSLAGLTESSKCPECGGALIDVLARRGEIMMTGKRYRSKATIFGLPVIDIAFGPRNGELRGRAKGVIAIGDIATGWLAFGGMARGVVAIGGMAVGLFSVGGLSIGLLTALGGGAIGGLCAGGGAIGALANGGAAIGYVAQGGAAVGVYARGGSAVGLHTISFGSPPDSVTLAMFDRFQWFFGTWPPSGPLAAWQSLVVPAAIIFLAALLITITALLAWRRDSADATFPPQTSTNDPRPRS